MDLAHAVPFAPGTRVWAGEYGDCAGAAVTVIAAGPGPRAGETRLDLARRNATIIGDIASLVAHENPAGIIVVATNPVDVLTFVAARVSGLPRQGGLWLGGRSSTRLDSAPCWPNTLASTRGASTPSSSASTATARYPSGRSRTSPDGPVRVRRPGRRPGRRGAPGRAVSADPRCGLRDHRAQGPPRSSPSPLGSSGSSRRSSGIRRPSSPCRALSTAHTGSGTWRRACRPSSGEAASSGCSSSHYPRTSSTVCTDPTRSCARRSTAST
jgi:hypothetical protein